MKRAIFLSLFISILFFGSLQYTEAKEVVVEVSGGGSGSENTVTTQSESEKTVTQSNDADINNDVTTQSDTGDNTANANTNNDTTISTGDTKTDVNIKNEQINTNKAKIENSGGSNGGSNISIEDNGAFSSNTIDVRSENSTTITQNNNADITNDVTTEANTGDNSALFNNGGTTIDTGDIVSNTFIHNKNINRSAVVIGGICIDNCFLPRTFANIEGNGFGSDNLLAIEELLNTDLFINNIAFIDNKDHQDLNTGDNKVKGNTKGEVDIHTGDIVANKKIVNENINISKVILEKKEKEKEKEQKPAIPVEEQKIPPVAPAAPVVSPAPAAAPAEVGAPEELIPQVLGAAAGVTLPVTGSFYLLLMIFANLMIFMWGLYLRYHSGRSPTKFA